MWALLMFVMMISVTGYYSLSMEKAEIAAVRERESSLASSMAVYRAAVVRYLSNTPGFAGDRVSVLQLGATLPAWYAVPTLQDLTPLWQNHVAPDGTITVYASEPLPRSVALEIVHLSQNSLLAGIALADSTLYSPVDNTGMPRIALPAAAGIPEGSPVWIAYAN